jgi:hypothetical protein
MGKLVNVVLPGGKVVSVPEELAEATQFGGTSHYQTLGEATTADTTQLNQERSAGLGEGITAAAEGFADAATGGLAGRIAQYAEGEDYTRNSRIRAKERPGARLAGEVAAMLVPTPLSVAAGAAGKVGGVLAEGAVYGLGATVADSNVTGDPLSIESLVQGAGVGAILNYGVSKIAKGIGIATASSKEGLEAERTAERVGNFFDSSPSSYNDLRATHSAVVSASKKANREFEKATNAADEAIKEFATNPSSISDTMKAFDNIERSALSQMVSRKVDAATDKIIQAGRNRGTGDVFAPLTDSEHSILEHINTTLSTARNEAEKLLAAGKRDSAVEVLGDAAESIRPLMPKGLTVEVPRAGASHAVIPKNPIELPEIPLRFDGAAPPPVPSVKLPSSVKGFAKMRPEDIAELANSVTPDSPLAQAIEKFGNDIGMHLGTTPGSTLAELHGGLQKALEATRKYVGAGEDGYGYTLLETLKNASKRALKYGTGRTADTAMGGAFVGAAAKVFTGATVGYYVDGIEGAIIGAQLLNSKASARSSLDKLFASYGQRAAGAVTATGPAVSFLSRSILTGEPDKDKDVRQQAANRIAELQNIAHVATDASFSAVQPLLTVEDDIAYKIHNQVMVAVNHLISTAPKDPGIAVNMFRSFWKPSVQEARVLEERLEAVLSPMTALKKLVEGKVSMETSNTLWATSPAHMQEAGGALAQNADRLGNLTREQSSALSRAFRIPLNGFAQGPVVAQLQSLFLPQVSAPQAPAPSGSGGVGGRPPKVSSPNPNQSRVSQLQRN